MSRSPLTGPWVWTGVEMAERQDWVWQWATDEVAELLAAGQSILRSGRPLEKISAPDVPLPKTAAKLALILRDLEAGPGLVNLRGLPADVPPVLLRAVLWAIGRHLGTPVSQSKHGELLGEVTDTGDRLGDPGARGYRTGGKLRFHTDRCDVVGLLCVRQSLSGGDSLIVSTPAIHNAMLERRPDLLELLFQPWYHSRQQEERPGEDPWYVNPVFALHQGRFTSQYSRSFIESAQRFPQVPRLTAAQEEALDLLAALAQELALHTRMEPGDIQFLNNHVTYHARTALLDHADQARKRLLYRLWLAVPNSRALPEDFAELWGPTAPGAVRGGVVAAAGYRSPLDLTLAGETA
ncbi:TauD/TfdA family dioxygenase [Siccirubricoccus sp. KC 17139]|uniref:TauD/TfdA family dioxygenase n=1 Tax=Siccirubricoccus soli TaxID=2899147 RepID=A0ABT1D7E1_9PROT|nr:TauD/TfdA family dioxygenase [Siccirubricoccus soli]MCO6417826.1 TauD/TfdA family dioxygenase [Siccirubricoccus soli]MCP2683961.1 TauD/TfdA family dioxygenase [Siccirubricoccus soli]